MRSVTGRFPRTPAAITVAVVALASCSSGDDASSDVTTASTDEAAASTTASATSDGSSDESTETVDPVSDDAASVAVDPEWVVDVAVAVPQAGIDTDLSVEFDPRESDQLDPFDRFASCSGLREWFMTYSVVVGDPTSEIGGVSVATNAPVVDAGVHDASIRVDRVADGPLIATGTVTIDAGFRSGSFVGFDVVGTEVSGTFDCAGSEVDPAPLTLGVPDDGSFESVEVVAKLESADRAERVVGLATTTDGTADLECPGAGGPGRPIVHVDGEPSIGAITKFDLSDGAPTQMVIRVGAAIYELADVAVTLAPDAASGSFSGSTVDGVAVDGAFRCD